MRFLLYSLLVLPVSIAFGQTNTTSSYIAIIPLDPSQHWAWRLEGNKPVDLTKTQTEKVDSLVKVCISENKHDEKSTAFIVGKEIGDHKFNMQLIPTINSKNEIVVWVNCFDDDNKYAWDAGLDWKKEVVVIYDGGGNGGLFNVMINLTENKYYDLFINGM